MLRDRGSKAKLSLSLLTEGRRNPDLCSAPLLPLTMPLLSTFFHHKKPCFPIRASTHCKCKCLTLTLLPYCGTEKVRGSRRPWCLNVCGQWEGTRPFIPLPTFISDRNCACKILNPAGVVETRSSIYFLWSSKNSNKKKQSIKRLYSINKNKGCPKMLKKY